MIPLKLHLHNFMCYRGEATLDLSGIHMACLAGDNGHGKSALLDALTYALWGETRARREDDLITMGADEMGVELEFLLGAERLRVIRKRSRRGKVRQTALELQSWDAASATYQALTGVSARDTQARILSLLRMNYETFINSAFLLQGRADEFARKPASERKQVLGDILGLSLYDEYEERAKQRVRLLEEESQRLASEIVAIQSELKQKPQREAELERLEREAAQANDQLRAAEAALQELRDEKRDLDLKAKQADEIEKRLKAARLDAQQGLAEVEQKRKTVEDYAARLGDAERIEAGFAQWQEARQRNEALNILLGQSAKLTEEKNRWELRVREARQALEFEARTRQERLAALDRQMAEAQALTPDLTEVQRVLVELAEKEKQLEQMRESREAHLGQVAELNGVNQQLKKHMLSLEDKIKLLQTAGAACPVCGQPISPEEAVRVSEEYREEGKRNAEGYRTNSDSINDLKWHVENLKTSAHKIELDLRRKAALQGREALLTQKLREASEAQVERDGLAAEWQALQTALEQKDYAHAEQAALAEVSAKLGALGYSAEEHEQARRLLSELAFYEPDHAQLQAARERLAAERELLGNLEANLERVRQAVAADETQWQALKAETARLAEVGQRIAGQQRQVNDLQGRTAILNRAVGAARQWVENAKNMEAQFGVKQEDLKHSQMERGLFEELRVAFGKKGIQAMLIEAAIPEIEHEANALLGHLSGGRMQVHFETQREKVNARKDDAVIETLDIVISDELGPRAYEMYSGGEAFRVNFAVRIALSKLLARRAGARLQTLVIDEGFGALDGQGRERLVEAINAVQEQFEKILVITHIDELKDAFPVRIDIVKTGGGSSIFVN